MAAWISRWRWDRVSGMETAAVWMDVSSSKRKKGKTVSRHSLIRVLDRSSIVRGSDSAPICACSSFVSASRPCVR